MNARRQALAHARDPRGAEAKKVTWKVVIFYRDGEMRHLQCGNGRDATFRTRHAAQEEADWLFAVAQNLLVDGDDVQSVKVVREAGRT